MIHFDEDKLWGDLSGRDFTYFRDMEQEIHFDKIRP